MRDGGKGDARRPLHVTEQQFESNWDNIFKGKQMTTFTTEDRLHAGEVPLTHEQIEEIYWTLANKVVDEPLISFVRAIERAHGIGDLP